MFNSPIAHRATFCHIQRFKAQMAYLHRFRYSVMSLLQALEALHHDRPLPRQSVALTFDDGCQNFRDHAFPVLQRYDFPATLFLVSGLIGKHAQWLTDEGRSAPKLMDRATILGLREKTLPLVLIC
jgi:peptidoglycan/xylan/chitin deacetylase (PgdA/CDA1 family)